MASIGGFDRTKELDELLTDSVDLGSGVKSVATRQANLLTNLGLTVTQAELNTLHGQTLTNLASLAGAAFTGRVTTTDGVASGTARVVGGAAFVDVNAADDITAATSNNAFVSFAQTYSIPANTLKAGSTLSIEALVRVTVATATVPTLTVKIRVGGTDLVATTAVAPTAGQTNDHHHLEATFVSRAAPGAAVQCVATGWWGTNTNGTQASGTFSLTPANFATNGALVVDVQAKWSTNAASNSARLEMLNVEII